MNRLGRLQTMSRLSDCTYNHVHLHNVHMHIHLIPDALSILFLFCVPVFRLSQLPVYLWLIKVF